jgi:hypothetical protein
LFDSHVFVKIINEKKNDNYLGSFKKIQTNEKKIYKNKKIQQKKKQKQQKEKIR